jgi:hypothetical protein
MHRHTLKKPFMAETGFGAFGQWLGRLMPDFLRFFEIWVTGAEHSHEYFVLGVGDLLAAVGYIATVGFVTGLHSTDLVAMGGVEPTGPVRFTSHHSGNLDIRPLDLCEKVERPNNLTLAECRLLAYSIRRGGDD